MGRMGLGGEEVALATPPRKLSFILIPRGAIRTIIWGTFGFSLGFPSVFFYSGCSPDDALPAGWDEVLV